MKIRAAYDYTDELGTLLYQAVRLEPKSFRQRQPDGKGGWTWSVADVRKVLYQLTSLLAADIDEWIYVAEGEKDVDNLLRLGLPATCNVGGAGKWADEYTQQLIGRKVCILPDNDKPGQDHARKVADQLQGTALEVRIVNLPGLAAKGDVSDWIAAGGTADQLRQLTQIATPYQPIFKNREDAPRAKPQTQRHESDDLVERIKAHWIAYDVFRYHGWANETQAERNGKIRLLGHGGLIVGDPLKPAERWQWYSHSEQVGGDQIDAWAHCTRRNRELDFVDILHEMAAAAGIPLPAPTPAPLPAGATIQPNGTITLKTTPERTPQPQPEPPALTPVFIDQLTQAINSPGGRALIAAHIDSRMKETFVVAAIALIRKVTEALGGWEGDIDCRKLGECLDKSHMSAWRNLLKFDEGKLVRYRHSALAAQPGEFPRMHLDLRPLVLAVMRACPEYVTGENVTGVYSDLKACNVFDFFSGGGEYADASMRVHPRYKGIQGRTLPSLTDASLTALTLPAQGMRTITRRDLEERLGMSAGAAAGATRRLEELGVCSGQQARPGKAKEYTFDDDYLRRLQEAIPQMASFNAHLRLRIGNLNDRLDFIDKRLKRMPVGSQRRELEERRTKLKGVRKKLIDRMATREAMARGEHHDNCHDESGFDNYQRKRQPYRRPALGAEGRALNAFVFEGQRAARLYGEVR